MLFCLYQEEETSVQVTEKGGHQAKFDLVWTKDYITTVDYVCYNIIFVCIRKKKHQFRSQRKVVIKPS